MAFSSLHSPDPCPLPTPSPPPISLKSLVLMTIPPSFTLSCLYCFSVYCSGHFLLNTPHPLTPKHRHSPKFCFFSLYTLFFGFFFIELIVEAEDSHALGMLKHFPQRKVHLREGADFITFLLSFHGVHLVGKRSGRRIGQSCLSNG